MSAATDSGIVDTHTRNMSRTIAVFIAALVFIAAWSPVGALSVAKANLADDVVPEGQFYDQQEVAAGKEPVSEESVPDFIRSSIAAATATEGFLQDTEDLAGYTQAGQCYTMRIGFKPWNGMEMASHFQTTDVQSLITGYKKGGDVAQSVASLTSKCKERCDASNDCTGFYYELSQYWVARVNDGGDGTGSALGDCQLFYQNSDTCVTDCLASPYYTTALAARGSDHETGMVTWLHNTWADQCQAYCGKPPAGRSDLQGRSHWSIKIGRNGHPTCTDPVGDCASEIARYKADSSMCGTWTWGGMGFSYKKQAAPDAPTDAPTDSPTDPTEQLSKFELIGTDVMCSTNKGNGNMYWYDKNSNKNIPVLQPNAGCVVERRCKGSDCTVATTDYPTWTGKCSEIAARHCKGNCLGYEERAGVTRAWCKLIMPGNSNKGPEDGGDLGAPCYGNPKVPSPWMCSDAEGTCKPDGETLTVTDFSVTGAKCYRRVE